MMGPVQAFKKGFEVVKKSMGLVLAYFLFGLVWNLINIPFASKVATGDIQASLWVTGLFTVYILIAVFFQGGMLGYVREKVKGGAVSVSHFSHCGAQYYLRLLGLGVIVMAIMLVAFGIVAVVMTAAGQSNIFALIVALAIAACAIYAALMMFMAPYVVVASEGKVFQSIRESVKLVRHNLGKLTGLWGIFLATALVCWLVLVMLLSLVSLAGKGTVEGTAFQVVFAAISSLINGFLGVFITAAFMTYYFALIQPQQSSNNT